MVEIPVYDKNNREVCVVEFTPNLNQNRKPSYVNEGGNLGLVRITEECEHKGCLALLYQDDWYPSCNRGELISDHDAWVLCQMRGKVHLREKLGIEWNRGII